MGFPLDAQRPLSLREREAVRRLLSEPRRAAPSEAGSDPSDAAGHRLCPPQMLSQPVLRLLAHDQPGALHQPGPDQPAGPQGQGHAVAGGTGHGDVRRRPDIQDPVSAPQLRAVPPGRPCPAGVLGFGGRADARHQGVPVAQAVLEGCHDNHQGQARAGRAIPLRPVRPGPCYPGLADGQGFRRAVRVPATHAQRRQT